MHAIKEDPGRRGLLFAGTERAVWMSFDDGDTWQSLQLNLPVTSMRDFEVYGDDLIVATHGRGFWVIDDISALRQINDELARASAFLFKPADAINAVQGGDNGTPLQKDEPQTPNRPNGAYIDYYLKSAPTGPVTIEVLDASGAVVATFSNEANAAAAGVGRAGGGGRGGGGGGIPNTTALWRPTPEPFSATPGMHRVSWTPGGGGGRGGGGGGRGGRGRGGAAASSGSFTVRMTVNGQTFTQPLTIRADPRVR